MDKEEWLQRCEAQFDKRVRDDKANWKDAAEVLFDEMHDCFPDDPEGAADEEMNCWDEDA